MSDRCGPASNAKNKDSTCAKLDGRAGHQGEEGCAPAMDWMRQSECFMHSTSPFQVMNSSSLEFLFDYQEQAQLLSFFAFCDAGNLPGSQAYTIIPSACSTMADLREYLKLADVA